MLMKHINNLQKFHDDAVKYIKTLIDDMDIWQRQIMFINCIKVIDKTYYDSVTVTDNVKGQFYTDILHFAYPVLIEFLYTEEFEDLPAAALAPMTPETLKECRIFLSACQLIGWSAYLLELERLNIVSVKNFINHSWIKFKYKYHKIEYLESKYTDYYEKIIFDQLAEHPIYQETTQFRNEILKKMESLCFVWMEHYMGYNGDQDVEYYFHDLAYIDAIHDSEWDMYPNNAKFADIQYGYFVEAIVDFSGYAIKHIYFAGILQKQHPELMSENLCYLIKTRDDLLKLIMENRSLSNEQATTILSSISLGAHNKDIFTNKQVSCAPLIKISQHQYIHSSAGSLYRPFSFMLENITNLFPEDCRKNRNSREKIFREQLYDMFKDEFRCIDHQIVLTDGRQKLTDIDAVIIDPKNGEIALFQLKWQDPTNTSPKSLLSKSRNYTEAAQKWIDTVNHWLEKCTDDEIAAKLGIKRKYIDKSKIYLFVLGRKHGNYSSNSVHTDNCVWVQWYHLLNYILRKRRSELLISCMHEELKNESPYNIKFVMKPHKYKYGKYTFVM